MNILNLCGKGLAVLRNERMYVLIFCAIVAVNIPNFLVDRAPKEKSIAKNGASAPQAHLSPQERYRQLVEENEAKKGQILEYLDAHPLQKTLIAFCLTGFGIIFLCGILINLNALISGRKLFEGLAHLTVIAEGKWTVGDVARATLLIVGIGYLISFLTLFLEILLPALGTYNARLLTGSIIIDITSAVVLFYYIGRRYNQGFRELGLYCEHLWQDIKTGFKTYVMLLPWLVVSLVLISAVINLFRYMPPPQPVYDLFMHADNRGMLIFTTLFAALAGPVFEELFFRGFLFSALRRRFSFIPAAAISSLFFSFLHVTPAGFIPIMLLGMLFCRIYEVTGSLIAPIAVHMAHNIAMIGAVLVIKHVTG